jgi:hypothetical protein
MAKDQAPRVRKGRKRGATSEPGKGPPLPPRPRRPRTPNAGKAPTPRVPDGKPRKLDEPSKESGAEPMPNDPQGEDPVVFSTYTPGADDGFAGFSVSDNVPDATGADGGEMGVVLRAYNAYLDVSTDRGLTFKRYDPRTFFTASLGAGLSGDQVIIYIPRIDRFVWFMQHSKSASGEGAFRLAVATPQAIRNDPKFAWTSFDFIAGDFGDSTQDLDFPDLVASAGFLYVGTDVFAAPASPGAKAKAVGRLIFRVPLDDLKTTSIGFTWVKITDILGTLKAKFAQGSTPGALWSGHQDNSTLRIWEWPDSSTSSPASHDVDVATWDNTVANITSTAPDGSTDWLTNLSGSIRNQVLGAARRGDDLWLAWTAGKGDGGAGGFSFPHPHVRVAQVNVSNWTLKSEMQVWNSAHAFAYPVLNVNGRGEVAIGVGFGGPPMNPDSAFGIIGDFVVWFVNGSDRALMRWGDYLAIRRDSRSDDLFAGFGYFTMNTTKRTVGYLFNPYYVRFGRKSLSPP